MNDLIMSAIQKKLCMTFYYDGQFRHVEPHAYGVSSAGNQVLRAYQTAGGHANDGGISPWHLFTVAKIRDLTLTTEHFSNARPKYERGDKGMSRIYAEL